MNEPTCGGAVPARQSDQPAPEDFIERFIAGDESQADQVQAMKRAGLNSIEIDVVLRQVREAREFHSDMLDAMQVGRIDADDGACAL